MQSSPSSSSEKINPAAPPSFERLIRSALIVMGGFMLTKGVSFLQAYIIAQKFGAGSEYDTFALGDTLPSYLVRLIGGGALSVAFIPVFSALLNEDNFEGAWRLASHVFNTLLLVAASVSIFVIIFAPILVKTIIAPGLNAADARQTAEILRILSVGTIIFSVSGIISGALQGHNHFFLPVLAPIFQDLGLLFGVIFFTGPFGIHGLAWGVLLGAVMHFAVQVPGLFMFKFRWIPELGWNDPDLRKVIRLMLPRTLIGAAFLINLVAINNINSRLGEGAASAFSWGIRIIDIPEALIGTAIAVVIFPTLSALSSMGRVEERRAAFSGVMRFILVATIPATAGIDLIAPDALRFLFNETETARILTVVYVMSLAIIVQSLHEVLTRAFYAQQDTMRPLIFSVIATVITVIWVVVMYRVYLINKPPTWSPLAVGAPAAGYVISFIIEAVLLTVVLRRRWGDIALPELTRVTLRTIAATVIMVIAVLIVDQVVIAAGFSSYLRRDIVLRVAVNIAAGAVSFWIAALLIGIQEVRLLPRLIFRRKSFSIDIQESPA